MNAAPRGPTRKKYLARTIQDFTTKVINGFVPQKGDQVTLFGSAK
jgi:hypothetical protein